jgi:protein required for attachment to host cells
MQESRQVEIALAREITAWLGQKYKQEKFKSLMLVAAPWMLGEIRRNLGKQLSAALIAESNKQLAAQNERDLTGELLRIIPGPYREK